MPVLNSSVGAAIDADSEVARIVERGECGFRVDPGDAAGLAREILRLAGNPDAAREAGTRGRVRAENEGSRTRAVEQYEDLLFSIARSRSR